jgi:hypothetical protein
MTTRLLPLPLLALLCGCENTLTIDLTDGPTDGAQEIVLDLASVKLRTDDGKIVELALEDGDPIDILAFQTGKTFRLVDGRSIDEGEYAAIALEFDPDGSFVTQADGDEVAIATPAALTFADFDFSIDENEELRIVLDLNMRFSLVDNDSGTYDLDPVLRAVAPGAAGRVSGTVAATFVESTECAQGRPFATGVAVYAFKGSDVAPYDYEQTPDLLDAANVELDSGTGEYRYELHFLPEGPYTLALTCEADAENPSTDDDLAFEASGNVTVTAGSDATLDFQ